MFKVVEGVSESESDGATNCLSPVLCGEVKGLNDVSYGWIFIFIGYPFF